MLCLTKLLVLLEWERLLMKMHICSFLLMTLMWKSLLFLKFMMKYIVLTNRKCLWPKLKHFPFPPRNIYFITLLKRKSLRKRPLPSDRNFSKTTNLTRQTPTRPSQTRSTALPPKASLLSSSTKKVPGHDSQMWRRTKDSSRLLFERKLKWETSSRTSGRNRENGTLKWGSDLRASAVACDHGTWKFNDEGNSRRAS